MIKKNFVTLRMEWSICRVFTLLYAIKSFFLHKFILIFNYDFFCSKKCHYHCQSGSQNHTSMHRTPLSASGMICHQECMKLRYVCVDYLYILAFLFIKNTKFVSQTNKRKEGSNCHIKRHLKNVQCG